MLLGVRHGNNKWDCEEGPRLNRVKIFELQPKPWAVALGTEPDTFTLSYTGEGEPPLCENAEGGVDHLQV